MSNLAPIPAGIPDIAALRQRYRDDKAALMAKLESDKAMDKDAEAEMNAAVTEFKKSFA